MKRISDPTPEELMKRLLSLEGSAFFGWFMDALRQLQRRHNLERAALFDVEGGLDEPIAFWNPAGEHRPFDIAESKRFSLEFRNHPLGVLYIDGWKDSDDRIEPWTTLFTLALVTKKYAV